MIKIAVCDDEILAVEELVCKIKNYMRIKGFQCIISIFLSGEALLAKIANQNNAFDTVFLDIKMNQINGIDTAKEIRKTDNKTIIVFVSALKEYVFDAFDVNAMNFLTKPIKDDKLFATLKRVSVVLNAPQSKELVISRGGEIIKISLVDIVYCEALNHRVFIYEERCTHEYNSKIDNLEKALDKDFFRCHRSYIINLRHVKSYSNGMVNVASGEKIPVATRRQTDFMKALLHYQRKGIDI